MKRNAVWRAVAMTVGIFCATTLAAQVALAAGGPAGGGGGGGGGKPPPVVESASNVSFPVIFSDNVGPSAFPVDGAWRFAATVNPLTECAQETNAASVIDPTILCYYGRHVSVSSDEGSVGQIVFDGAPKVWWLQKRSANFWKALSVGHDVETKLAVSAVDVGDLLESTPSIATRQIRTEFNLLQNVASDDPELGRFVVPPANWASPIPSPCVMPAAAGQSIGCFAAVAMSGAVPGTEQSGNEAQGTDFGPGMGAWPGTRMLVDPTTVRTATDELGNAIPIQAIVYSHCARLVIQKIDGTPTWDPSTGRWSGSGVGSPVVNVSAYGGTYSSEINSGGGLVYGYNWNAKTAATGTYRLTFVLDGNSGVGPQCTTTLATEFQSGVTKLVNVGENNAPHIIYAGDSAFQGNDTGGLVYLDLALTPKGGGSKGGGGK